MAKKGSHYVKKSAKKYLTDKDKKLLIIAAIVIVVIVAAFFIITSLSDKALEVKDGKVVGAGDNWLISSADRGAETCYYKYGEYDFSGYDGEVVPGTVSYDDNATCVELYPADGRYADAFVYAGGKTAEFTVNNVSSQIGYLLENGDVHEVEEFMDGYIYWYTATETQEAASEDEAETVVYKQVFSAYLPADSDGCIIVRVTYDFDTDAEYVAAETGYAEVKAIAECIEY